MLPILSEYQKLQQILKIEGNQNTESDQKLIILKSQGFDKGIALLLDFFKT